MKFVYPFLMVFLASTTFAQKAQKIQKADTLITATDTLVFLKDTVKLSKVEMLVRQANDRQYKPLEAVALYKKALAAKTKDQDSTWIGDIRLAMAKMYFKANNSTDGFLQLLAAQSLYSQVRNMSCQSAVAREIAEIYEKNNDWTEAERYYLVAFKQQESVGLTLDMPYTSLALAHGYYKQKDYANAEKYYTAALNQFELNVEKNKRAEALVQLADIKIKQKNYAQAEHLILKRAMPFFSSVGKPEAKTACFNMLGDLYYIQNRQSEAKWFYIQAYTNYQNAGDKNGVIRSIVNLAKVKSALGDKKAALKDFKDAEAMAVKNKNLALAADVKVAYARYYNKPKAKVEAASKAATNPVVVKKTTALATMKDSLQKNTAEVKPKVKPQAITSKPFASSGKTGAKPIQPAVRVVVKKDSTSAKAAVKTLKPVVVKEKTMVVAAQLKASAVPGSTEKIKEEKVVAKGEKDIAKDELTNVIKN